MDPLSRTGLPLLPYLPQIGSLLAESRTLVLTAEPGTGKSTLVPPYLLDAEWLRGRTMIMLEPRRLAAASVASRIAELLGEPLGGRAGYRVRGASRVGPRTRIEVVTEALLTRMIQEDPLLENVGLLIFDEFHERSIHTDLGLALALEARGARQDLGLLVMSATMETDRISTLLGGAPVLQCPGRSFPVETRYSAPARLWEADMARGVERLFNETEGDILAFLPGIAEIRRMSAALTGRLGGRADVLWLYGSLSLEEQRRVIGAGDEGGRPGDGRRRIILATSIAETSLTVPGIHAVADSGLSRVSRFHPPTGLDRLVTETSSAASADQRRGRAGRLGPGLCVRFWKETEKRQAESEPEIKRADLAGLTLECALWGARDPTALKWLDPPPSSACTQAMEVLVMLGLISDGRPTETGRKAAALGLHPRLGVLSIQGAAEGLAGMAAACAALLSERDGSGLGEDPDLRPRLAMIRAGSGGSAEWRGRILREISRIVRRTGGKAGADWSLRDEDRIGDLLSRAYPDRVARRSADGTYRFPSGRAARFPAHAPGHTGIGGGARVQAPSRAAAEWIVAPEADAGDPMGAIRLAAPLDRGIAESALLPLTEETTEIRWDGMTLKSMAVRRAGRLILSEKPAAPAPGAAAAAIEARIRKDGSEWLPWDDAARGLYSRMRFLAKQGRTAKDGGIEGIVSDMAEELGRRMGEILESGGGRTITPGLLVSALRAAAGAEGRLLREKVPEKLVLPTERDRGIDYSTGIPTVEARIQEVFGLKASPRICGIPVVFKLLSPAHRPLQTTDDLAGFWKSTYAEIRKEMRGRYPKHYWPEDPGKAEPITGVRPKKTI